MLVVGLTGGIGSGKSTVSALLADKGAVIVDADAIVRELQAPGGAAYEGIVERFGSSVVAGDGTLDRPALAAIVFTDSDARRDLERLTYPHLGRVMAERMAAQAATDNIVILDIPLLGQRTGPQAPGRYPTAAVIVVDCPIDVAVERVVTQRGMSEDDARARVAAQVSREERTAMADLVIDNSRDREHLATEVDRAWLWIQALPGEPAAVP